MENEERRLKIKDRNRKLALKEESSTSFKVLNWKGEAWLLKKPVCFEKRLKTVKHIVTGPAVRDLLIGSALKLSKYSSSTEWSDTLL